MYKISSKSNTSELINIDELIDGLGLVRRLSLNEFNSIALRTKKDVVYAIGDIYDDIYHKGVNSKFFDDDVIVDKYSVEKIKRIMERIYLNVKNSVFFEKLEPWWCYKFILNETGAKLKLIHYEALLIYPNGKLMGVIDHSVRYLSSRADYLSVEEYANLFNVSEITVRQWIRRGKLRCAIKTGSGWRIPDLSIRRKRGYKTANYDIEIPFEKEPEEYPFLVGVEHIGIYQNKKEKNTYTVSLSNKSTMPREISLTKSEKERFELFLISNTDFKADSAEILSAGTFNNNYSYLLEQ